MKWLKVVKNNFKSYPSMICSETVTEKGSHPHRKTTTGPGYPVHLLASLKAA